MEWTGVLFLRDKNGSVLNLSFCFTKPTAHLPPRPDDLKGICWRVTCHLPGHVAPERFPENLGKRGGAERATSQRWSPTDKLCVLGWGGGGKEIHYFMMSPLKKCGLLSVAARGG